jgi:hypothetical protein
LRKPPHAAFKSKHQSKYKFRIATPSSALQASPLKNNQNNGWIFSFGNQWFVDHVKQDHAANEAASI